MRRVLQHVLAAAVVAAPLAGQQPAPRDSARRDSVVSLNPITVRGTQATAVIDQPFAVTRVSPAAVRGTRGIGLDEALAEVPGVVAQSRAGGTDIRLTIRGFGSRGAGDRSNAGTTRGVRVLLDGIPETEPDGRTAFDQIDLATVASIEVIRSNAGSLWGNAAGGVVSVTTIDPDAPAHAALETAAGGFGLRRQALTLGAPFAGGAVAASLTRTSTGGWRAHSAGTRTLANVSLVTHVGPATRLGVFAVASANEYRIPGPLTRADADTAPMRANATYAARDEHRRNHLGRLGVTLDHEFTRGPSLGGMLFVSPKFLQRSERGTFRDFTRYHVGGNVVGRVPVRLAGRPGLLTVGVDEAYQDGAAIFYGLTPQNTRDTVVRDNKREGANNLGVFVQHELPLGERLDVTVGARYDAITYSVESFVPGGRGGRRTFARLTPKLALGWRVGRGHRAYVTLGGGVEAPAANETDPAGTFGQDSVFALNPLLEPIRSTSLEAGVKRATAGRAGSLVYDVAAYHTVVTNEIIPYRGGRFYFSAGEARRSGAELGASAVSRHGVRLGATVTYSHHRYRSYTVDSVHYADSLAGRFADYAGHRVVGVPDVAYTLSAGYDVPGVPLLARVIVQGMTRWYADDANTVVVPAFTVTNLVLGTAAPLPLGGAVGVRGSVAVNNVFDRRYIGSAFLNPDVVGGEAVAFEPGLPRHLVVTVALQRQDGAARR